MRTVDQWVLHSHLWPEATIQHKVNTVKENKKKRTSKREQKKRTSKREQKKKENTKENTKNRERGQPASTQKGCTNNEDNHAPLLQGHPRRPTEC
jgi:hypothetical protein